MTCPSMLYHPDSVDDVAYTSFLSNPGVSLSVSKGNSQHYAFHLSLCYRKLLCHSVVQCPCLTPVSHYWSNVLIVYLRLNLHTCLRLLVMLSTLPKAAQPSAILLLISGSRSPSRLIAVCLLNDLAIDSYC